MRKYVFLLIVFAGFFSTAAFAQTLICQPNMDFELGNYSYWKYTTGTCCPMNISTTVTPPNPRFALTTGTANDTCCGFPVVGEGVYSLRLGYTVTNYYAERASYYVHVPAGTTNYSLVYRYAFVMQDPSHSISTQPRFEVKLSDSASGMNIDSFVYVAGSIPGTYFGATIGGSSVICKSWTTQIINLSGYSGRTVIASFAAGDCGQGGHFGYAYVDMTCGLFAVNHYPYCGSELLVAPTGFNTYAWYDSSTFTTLWGTNDSIYVPLSSITSPTTLAVIATPYPGYGSPDTLYTTIYPGGGGVGLPPITGNTNICLGGSTALSNATPGGTWSSSATGVASVNSANGVVSGVSLGTAVISYYTGPGCQATTTVTVSGAITPITGTPQVCTGSTTRLSDATAGGTWSSANTSIATVNASGVVSGVSAGTAVILYNVPCGSATYSVTVSPSPSVITSPLTICLGATITLSNTVAGGTWSSSNPSVASVSTGGVMTGAAAGNATISYTAAGGCSRAASVVVKQPPSVISGNSGVCAGLTITLSNTVPGGTWTSSAPTIASVAPGTGVVTGGTGAGTAVISYTTASGAGCVATTTITISPGPSAISGNTSLCAGSSAVLSNMTAGGTWSSNNTSVASISAGGTVDGISAGNAVITYAMGGGCYRTVTVTVAPSPSVISGSSIVCAGLTIVLSNTAAGGTWSSASPGIATVTNTGVVTGVAVGNAVISYTTGGGSGCTVTTTVSVGPGPSAISGNTNMCEGASVILSNMVSGGTWSSSNSGIANISAGSTVDGISAGGAVITYTMPGGCYRTVTVTVSAAPSVIYGASVVCTGSTVNLSNTVAGGTWSSASPGIATVTNTGTVTGVTAGTVIISYTAPGGQGCTVTTTITVGPGPSAISGNTSLCIGSSTALSNMIAGGTWSSSNSSVASVNASGNVDAVSAGAAVISYTVPGGCFRTVSVTVSAPPSVISGAVAVCEGLTISLSNSTAGGTWISSSTGTATVTPGGVVTGVTGGAVVISYTTASGPGCTATTTVTVNPGPSVISGASRICLGSTVNLSNTVAGGTWSSSNTSVATLTGSTVTGTGAGTAIITYMLTGGCFRTTSVTVAAPPSAISGSTTLCAFTFATLSNTVAGGTWSSTSPTIATVDPTTGKLTGISPGTSVISYVTAPGGGCQVTVTVTVLPAPSVGTITGPANVCAGSSIALTNAQSGGTWSSSDVTVATITGSGAVSGVNMGVAVISYTVGTPCGPAFTTYTVTVTGIPDAGVLTAPAHLCTGGPITLSSSVAGGVWSSSNNSIATTTAGGIANGVSTGTVVMTYIVTNSCGADTATTAITVDETPDAGFIGGPATVCAGAVFSLTCTVAGGAWSSSSTAATVTGATGQVHALSTGVIIITYTTGSICPGIATHTLTVVPASFSVNAAVTQVACHGESTGSISVTIGGGTGIHNYLWSDGSTAPAISGLAAGVYVLHVTEPATQCMEDTTFTIAEPDSLYCRDSVLQNICLLGNGAIYISAYGGTPSYSYHWSTGSVSSALENLSAGVYTVTVSDINNCSVTLAPEVTDSVCAAVKPHDAVTPNGDGVNDAWIIEGIEAYPDNEVMVFDKWGDKVYEQKSYKNTWDGRGRSGLLPDGTYYYVIKLAATNMRSEQVFTGSLLIKR